MNKKIEINGITGEIIERDFTNQELELIRLDEAQAKIDAKTQADRDAAKQAVLAKLGLTSDELAALLGA